MSKTKEQIIEEYIPCTCGDRYKKAMCKNLSSGWTILLWVPQEAKIGDTIVPIGLNDLYVIVYPEIKYQ